MKITDIEVTIHERAMPSVIGLPSHMGGQLLITPDVDARDAAEIHRAAGGPRERCQSHRAEAHNVSSVSLLYPNRVSTFRVICSICGSRPASP